LILILDIFALLVEDIYLSLYIHHQNIRQLCAWLSICPPLPPSIGLFPFEVDTPRLNELALLQQCIRNSF